MRTHPSTQDIPLGDLGEEPSILVTGIPRAGTSWVGKMLQASGRVVYINEPMNPTHPPGQSPGVLKARVRFQFQYISAETETPFLQAFRDTLALRYHPLAEVARNHGVYDLLRLVNNWSGFVWGKVRNRRPLLDDPYAVLSTEWFSQRLGCQTVAVVRRPEPVVASWKRQGWRFDFRGLLAQPSLMRDWLEPYRSVMERTAQSERDVVEQVALLWRVIHHVLAGLQRLDNLHLVRHEDLSLDPVGGFQRLYETLGLPFGDRARDIIVRSTTAASSDRAHSWTLGRAGLSKTAFRPLNSRAYLTAWKRWLTEEEAARVRRLTGDVLRTFYRTEGAPSLLEP